MGGLVGEHLAGKVVLAGDFEGVGILLSGWVEREGYDRLTKGGRFGGEGQEGNLVLRSEGIRRGEENGDVVLCVRGNHGRWQEARRAIEAADQNIWLAAVPKRFKNMRGSKEVALIVNEEAVAKEAVAVTTRGCGLVKLINDRANSGGERVVVDGVHGRGSDRQAAKETGEKSHQPRSATSDVLTHLWQEPFPSFSGTPSKKVTAVREAGKTRKRTGKKGLDK